MSKINKYRAWNTEKKIMCYDNEDFSACYWEGVYSSEVGIINKYLNLPEHLRDYEYMQYIGVDDKNGKGIYEGDIVRDERIQLLGVVKFSERYLQFVVDDIHDGEQDYSEFMNQVEVIGNVYENADLLKEE